MLKSRVLVWSALAVIALATGIATYLLKREVPEPEAPPPEPIAKAVIPARLPDIMLNDRDNNPRALTEWNGQPLVINFWATWCAPCRREMPMLNQLAGDLKPKGVEVIGIAIDFREDVLKYLKETPIDYTVLIGEQAGLDAARAFGMETVGLPFTAFTDKRGRIATIHVGELHRNQADVILAAVEAVDAGSLSMVAARQQMKAELAKIAVDRPE